MEEPSSGVISNDTKSDGMHRGDLDRVTTHGVSLTLNEWRVQSWVVRSIVLCPSDELHLVSVQMAIISSVKGVRVWERASRLTRDAFLRLRS